MNIAVRFYASLFSSQPRPDCSFGDFKQLMDLEQMRCDRRGVELHTIELEIDQHYRDAILKSVAPKLTPIDAATINDGRLIILCPGHDEAGNRDVANQLTQLCRRSGLQVCFEVVSHCEPQPTVKSDAYQFQTPAAIAAS